MQVSCPVCRCLRGEKKKSHQLYGPAVFSLGEKNNFCALTEIFLPLLPSPPISHQNPLRLLSTAQQEVSPDLRYSPSKGGFVSQPAETTWLADVRAALGSLAGAQPSPALQFYSHSLPGRLLVPRSDLTPQ